MGFLSNLFGSSWQKQEDKGDESRLDLLYREAVYFYQKALDELGDENPEAASRITHKLQEVRRKAVDDLLQDAKDFIEEGDGSLARERLESAALLTENPERIREVEALLEAFESGPPPEPAEGDLDELEEVASTDEDVYALSLETLEERDRNRATTMGAPFRAVFQACQEEAWARALDGLKSLSGQHPGDPLLLEMTAVCYERLDRLDEARAAYRKAHEREADRPGTIHGLVDLLRRAGEHDEAAALLAQAVSVRPEAGTLSDPWMEICIDHALTAAEGGDAEAGLGMLKEMLAEPNAKPGGLYFNMAGIFEQAGQDAEARAALEKAMAASPRNPLYKERLSDYLVHRGRELKWALDLLVQANADETTTPGGVFGGGGAPRVKVSPNRGRYLYKMARIYFMQGDDLEAEKTVTTAVALTRDPDVIQALESLKDEIQKARKPS